MALAAALARARGTEVRVFAIARVHGTSLGLPMPGLLPSKREWDEQREIVHGAVRALRRQGITASARVVGTRRAAKRIVQEAVALGCDTIVMGADPRRAALVADFLWSQEPYRARRRGCRAGLQVHLVTAD